MRRTSLRPPSKFCPLRRRCQLIPLLCRDCSCIGASPLFIYCVPWRLSAVAFITYQRYYIYLAPRQRHQSSPHQSLRVVRNATPSGREEAAGGLMNDGRSTYRLKTLLLFINYRRLFERGTSSQAHASSLLPSTRAREERPWRRDVTLESSPSCSVTYQDYTSRGVPCLSLVK